MLSFRGFRNVAVGYLAGFAFSAICLVLVYSSFEVSLTYAMGLSGFSIVLIVGLSVGFFVWYLATTRWK